MRRACYGKLGPNQKKLAFLFRDSLRGLSVGEQNTKIKSMKEFRTKQTRPGPATRAASYVAVRAGASAGAVALAGKCVRTKTGAGRRAVAGTRTGFFHSTGNDGAWPEALRLHRFAQRRPRPVSGELCRAASSQADSVQNHFALPRAGKHLEPPAGML